MKIEKIKSYNQKLLALLGTVVLIIAIIALGMIVFEVGSDIVKSFRNDDQISGILSDDEVAKLKQQNERKQLVSYQAPQLIDTTNSIYLISVSQKTLKKAEQIPSDAYELFDFDRRSKLKVDRGYGIEVHGPFINLLVYDERLEKVKKLFDYRVNFRSYNVKYFDDDILVSLTAAEKDTNQDNLINNQDLTSIYLYSFKTDRLTKIGMDSLDISSYEFIYRGKDILVRFGIDHNKDGRFESYKEPSHLKKYIFETDTLVDIIDSDLNTELQQLLEGSKE